MRAKVEQELEQLKSAGVTEPAQFSDWATPIVPVLEQDGSVRICGDYRTTMNQTARTESCPLSCIHKLFASLNGGKTFATLDLEHAYQQILLNEESRKLVVIITHKGLLRYNRLPFGVTSAQGIFNEQLRAFYKSSTRLCIS